ncbi:MAG: ferrochelatase [Alphaproteobacteria bacterium]|nr:ferrochelatase [Alphaproteobacteria bacterium]
MARIAVVLMNLGGPDALEAVQPFLFNLFSDPAIIRLPAFLRLPLARLISKRRARVAREIYRQLDGRSPLLVNTKAQARALEEVLGPGYRCFIAMRYWHPASAETARDVAAWAPDEIVCLPLYPQFSTTTTASSLAAWRDAAKNNAVGCTTRVICCYPAEAGFVETVAGLVRPVLDSVSGFDKPPRLLLTAHGLPRKVVHAGDPYPDQVGSTAAAVVAALDRPGLDWQVCYQSRVGPLAWIGPYTDGEIRRAGRDGVPLVVAPISFVSEHSETLVELDLDYRRIAELSGVPAYRRVATVGVEPGFIQSLASLVRRARTGQDAGSCAPPQPRRVPPGAAG